MNWDVFFKKETLEIFLLYYLIVTVYSFVIFYIILSKETIENLKAVKQATGQSLSARSFNQRKSTTALFWIKKDIVPTNVQVK